MRAWLVVVAGLAGCNGLFALEDTELRPLIDAAVAPDGDPRVDLDRDGIRDVDDTCIAPDTDLLVDTDGDGTRNAVDSCPLDRRPTGDTDGDGVGDLCDPSPVGGDRVRCVMALTDPELNLMMWRPRESPSTWLFYMPRTLYAMAAGSTVADWPLEAPGVTTYSIFGFLYSNVSSFSLLARGSLDPAAGEVGCTLVRGATWSLVVPGGLSIDTGVVAGQRAQARILLSATLIPAAPDGVTLRCSAQIDEKPTVRLAASVDLPLGTLGFSTTGANYLLGISIYERDDAPP